VQTLKNYEHIFIDSYSSDGTKNIISRYKKGDFGKVKLFLTKTKGISNAMNIGIVKAKGEYLIHLHSDDYFYDKHVLEHVQTFLINNNFPDWIYGKICVVEESGKNIGIFPNGKIFQTSNHFLLKFFNFIPHQAVFIKKQIFERFGVFDNTLSSSMDYDFWLRVARRTRWLFINRLISKYTIRKGAQSSDREKVEINNDMQKKVAKKYLNKVEFFLHLLVKIPIDIYNKTLR
jgi:glycosyltransferase